MGCDFIGLLESGLLADCIDSPKQCKLSPRRISDRLSVDCLEWDGRSCRPLSIIDGVNYNPHLN